MHPNHRLRVQQQNRVRHRADQSDAYTFFNLLTGPDLLDKVESLLPEHRERLFPPTEALSMFLSQALSADRSCQRAVNEAAVKRLIGGLSVCSTHDLRLLPRAHATATVDARGPDTAHRPCHDHDGTPRVALARSPGAAHRRHHGGHARHASKPSGVPATA